MKNIQKERIFQAITYNKQKRPVNFFTGVDKITNYSDLYFKFRLFT